MNPTQSNVILRTYNEEHDGPAVFDLYQTCLQDVWPLAADVFHMIVSQHADYRAGDHVVAEKAGHIVGFVATQRDRAGSKPSPKGGIGLLLVHPDQRRQGIGRRLHDMALGYLGQAMIHDIHLANGNAHRFWQGVPHNLSAATAFFQACGWQFQENSADLIGDTGQVKTLAEITKGQEIPNIHIRLAKPEDTQAILDFEDQEFPHWKAAFQTRLEQGQFEDILIAHNDKGEIVGSLTLSDWRSPQAKREFLWSAILGEKLGALGVVGVVESQQGQGIGSALVAKGAEILKSRGVACIHIFWTGRVNFYERLGYTLWQEFHHMTRSENCG